MGNSRSREPASASRPARRSLVELTEAAQRAASEAALPSSLIASALAEAPQSADVASMPDLPTVAAKPHRAVEDGKQRHGAPAPGDVSRSGSTAELAVKLAKACQASTLDDIKTGLDVALDCALGLATGRTPFADASKGHDGAVAGDETAPDAAAEYRTEALELMKANMTATLNYTRGLLSATTSADVVELSGTHMRTQCELILQQTRVLRSLARTMTRSEG